MSSTQATTGTTDRILDAALELLEREGAAALTTRAVCEIAGVTAPTMYHHFSDKEGLIRALLGRETGRFIQQKRGSASGKDPVAELRAGWDQWIDFAMRRPRLVALYRQHAAEFPHAAAESHLLILARAERVAAAGLLRQDAETTARALMAASNGVVDLILQGLDRKTIRKVNAVIRDALFEAVLAAERKV